MYFIGIFISILVGTPSFSQESETSVVPEIIVTGKNDGNLKILNQSIQRVEKLRPHNLRHKQAQTFSQLLSSEKGLDSQTACAFCGAKRITINGLKGEHTTILIDGLPLHSTVSSFYGVDAIPLGGIDSIDIYRGSGAALSAPESIGGAINIITREIISNEFEVSLTHSDDGQKNISLLGTKKLTEKTGFLLGIQSGEILPIDNDNNNISESPRQNTESASLKFSHRWNEQHDTSLRFGYANLSNVGGSLKKTQLKSFASPTSEPDDFLERDVRQKYIGDINKITDNINLKRFEAAIVHRWYMEDNESIKLSTGGAWQEQNAIYNHGYDYDNNDSLWVGQAEYQKPLNAFHTLNIGLDSKNQRMKSDSEFLYRVTQPPLLKDDFKYKSLGGFLQDTWSINDKQQISLALRWDQINTDWDELKTKIDETVFAPRFMYKLTHNSTFTSRISAGIGYRSPLTLFESQHGIYHNGFSLEIDELEIAESITYSLSGQRLDDFFEWSVHNTKLKNMAFGEEQEDITLPMIFKNSDNDYNIFVTDLSYGRRFLHLWTVEALLEHFYFQTGYKEKLPVAAIERRFSINSNIDWKTWKFNQRLILIGSRDLTSYGYDSHFNIAPSSDPFDNSFGGEGEDLKKQKAPSFFTLDLTAEKSISKNWAIAASILNVFDYTQVEANDSPTTWEGHDDHFHLDNFHIWGPNRGRQIFLTLRGNL